ncbi:hypothetical protein DPSP01_002437 [Paraphaeosphaeria sporulosa]|uniref:Uncharacterized protein n=1 Tax=Paraphaeosphaeria sporulosa TaxID=1460663 RepID=A0A177C156_9PLEO|nr:uncharacterized protein CC84DRAFT_277278 [Paraphaeosphaeria sporulosa]OAG01156.1 hypothetical protein CC84DRAFT_277278 [Paraphaeosphaeria sporulosa]
MHRKNPISVLVYNALFPNPSPNDPPSFSAHLSKNLVGEVRIETATFYGSLDTIEARYPGLNYAHAPHRKRLGRFPHHKKLFDAFDRLNLTDSEIQGFCRWEGTLWARERYERDEGVKVRDTTGMEIGEWVDRRRTTSSRRRNGINVKTDIEVEIEEVPSSTEITDSVRPVDTEMQDSSEDEDDGDNEQVLDESVGFALNQRLLQAAALREQGQDAPMDPEWEQYLKDAQERGEHSIEHLGISPTISGDIAGFDAMSEGPSAPSQPYPPVAPA